jgi:malate dehydrogenase (quinone)
LGSENVAFLKNFDTLQSNIFKEMTYSTDFSKLKEWMPLVMEGRGESDTVAATNMPIGTDVNFGELT